MAKDDEGENSDEDIETRKKRLEEQNRFKMKPPGPEDYNPDGSLKFKPLSRLMLKL